LESATVLVVDDQPFVRNTIKAILTHAGLWVVVADSPTEALEVCRKSANSIKLALIDVVMPGANGPEIREALRAEFPDMPVLLMSGYPFTTFQGVDFRPVDFIQKPFTPKALLERVRGAMEVCHAPVETKSAVIA
jgi:two-component system cell cycle sensor histidine kinase/response regulator CckA